MLHAFHCNWTAPFFARYPNRPYEIEPFELLSTALSALVWQRENGSIRMLCDTAALRYYQALGLDFLWDAGIVPVLDDIPSSINPAIFWAGGKLFALRTMPCPCVMLDTDFIVWKPLLPLVQGQRAAVIHSEAITDEVYPSPHTLQFTSDFSLEGLDCTVKPLNTALAYFADEAFRTVYTDAAIAFMQACPRADNTLTYMVFAEQRLLAMCAKQQGVQVGELSALSDLFGGKQRYFTHIWGFKQQMKQNPALYFDFCVRCAKRLKIEFAHEAAYLAALPSLACFFSAIE